MLRGAGERGQPAAGRDLSALSFHATKVFHTFEGGAVVCSDPDQADHRLSAQFRLPGRDIGAHAGINAKLNEVQSAFGLLHLEHIDEVIAARQAIDSHFRFLLRDVEGIAA